MRMRACAHAHVQEERYRKIEALFDALDANDSMDINEVCLRCTS